MLNFVQLGKCHAALTVMLFNIVKMNFKDKNLVPNIKVQFMITFIPTLMRNLQTKVIIQVFEDVHHESIQLHITDTRQLV